MQIVLTPNEPFPAPTKRVLDSSVLDGLQAWEWLINDDIELARRACLLNILAVLNVTPTTSEPLIDRLIEVFTAKAERIYGVFDGSLRAVLDQLVADPAQLFYVDFGKPLAVHRELLQNIPARLHPPASTHLSSYRGVGSPSLQMVLTDESRGCVMADVDLDEYNPDQDVVSLLGHTKELIRGKGGPTDHLAMRTTLALGPAAPFLCYSII